jgi:hypothetical protein
MEGLCRCPRGPFSHTGLAGLQVKSLLMSVTAWMTWRSFCLKVNWIDTQARVYVLNIRLNEILSYMLVNMVKPHLFIITTLIRLPWGSDHIRGKPLALVMTAWVLTACFELFSQVVRVVVCCVGCVCLCLGVCSCGGVCFDVLYINASSS